MGMHSWLLWDKVIGVQTQAKLFIVKIYANYSHTPLTTAMVGISNSLLLNEVIPAYLIKIKMSKKVLPTNEQNPEWSVATVAAQRTGRRLTYFLPDTGAQKSQFVRLFAFTILHLLTSLEGEKR
jgi:hypothetical protein